MLGDLNGPMLLALIAVIALVVAAIVTVVIVLAVKSSAKRKQADLQRAYAAGQESQQH